MSDFLRKGPPFPAAGYDELEASHILPRTDHYRITPSPGGLGDRYGKFTQLVRFSLVLLTIEHFFLVLRE